MNSRGIWPHCVQKRYNNLFLKSFVSEDCRRLTYSKRFGKNHLIDLMFSERSKELRIRKESPNIALIKMI